MRDRGLRGKPSWACRLAGLSLHMPSLWWLVRLRQLEAATSYS